MLAIAFVISCPALAEEFWCEGLDDDLDGLVDEICPATCEGPYKESAPVGVAGASIGTTALHAARSGTGLGFVYADPRSGTSQVYLRLLAVSGAPDAPELLVSDGVHAASDPAVVWSGSYFGVAWVDERDGNPEIYFRLVTNAGAPGPAAPVVLSSSAGASLRPSVVWTGTEFGVAWDDVKGSNRDIYFRRVSAIGATIGQTVRVTSETALQEQPSLVWDGTQYALAWTDERHGNREIYVRRLDAAGATLGSEVRVTNATGTSEAPSLVAYAPEDFGIAWQDARSGQDAIWYGRWTGPLYPAPAGVPVTSGPGAERTPTIASTGSEAIVAWVDTRVSPDAIWGRRVSTDGAALSAELQLSDALTGSQPHAVWHGSGVSVLFRGGSGAASPTPHLVNLGCAGGDADLDGFSVAQGDCNDASSIQSPAAPETCDGLDGNCDGTLDETCAGICPFDNPSYPTEIKPGPAGQGRPSAVWDGTGYAVAWEEVESSPQFGPVLAVWFRKVDSRGQPLGTPLRVSPAGRYGSAPSLVWTGSEYAVAWEQYTTVNPNITNIALARIPPSGDVVVDLREITRDPPVLTTGFKDPSLVWTGSGFAVAFTEMSDDPRFGRAVLFLRCGREGIPRERSREVSHPPAGEQPFLLSEPSGFALAYMTQQDPSFRRLDRHGGMWSPATQILDDVFTQFNVSVARSAAGFGVVWLDNNRPWDVFQRFDSGGTLVGTPIVFNQPDVGSAASPVSLTWLGNEFLAALDEGSLEISLLALDEAGNRKGPALRIDQDAGGNPHRSPVLVWNGVHPAVAWSDTRSTSGLSGRIVVSVQSCCAQTPPPSAVDGIRWTSAEALTWTTNGSDRYDRVRGSLSSLRQGSGTPEDWSTSVIDCVNDLTLSSSSEAEVPVPSAAFYYLVRGDGICGAGSWNEPGAPFRDEGINASPNACP